MARLSVNGEEREVDLPEDTPLLWALRDGLGLTGTKYGCGAALCGTCLVHLDGAAVPSCQVPLGQAAGRRVTTIEGLSADRSHPVQRAWLAEQVPQCGWCQSGQIMAAAALLAATASPSPGSTLRPPSRERPVPLTYRLEFKGPAGTTVLRAGLGYVRALRWTVRLGQRLRREGLAGELRVVEDAFGMLVARRRIEVGAVDGDRDGERGPRSAHREGPER